MTFRSVVQKIASDLLQNNSKKSCRNLSVIPSFNTSISVQKISNFAKALLSEHGNYHIQQGVLKHTVDRYRGVHVVLDEKCGKYSKIQNRLEESIESWKAAGKTAVWLHVPIKMSDIIPEVLHHGFKFHHAEENFSSLALWLHQDTETRIPISASHQVGVGGCCIDIETQKILVIREKNKKVKLWKIPGGFSYLGENFYETATREVFEETGVTSSYQSIIGFRQQHNFPGAFGKSDLYVVVRLTPLSFTLTPCPREVEECRWMHIKELLKRSDLTPLTAQVIKVVDYGLSTSFDNIDIVVPANVTNSDNSLYSRTVSSK